MEHRPRHLLRTLRPPRNPLEHPPQRAHPPIHLPRLSDGRMRRRHDMYGAGEGLRRGTSNAVLARRVRVSYPAPAGGKKALSLRCT
jgi:hypothetical protein